MFGFHKRNRSLIPVKSIDALEISEKRMLLLQEEELDVEEDDNSELGDEEPGYRTRQDRRNLVMIYMLFLAEAPPGGPPIPMTRIAAEANVPRKFLELILADLRDAGFTVFEARNADEAIARLEVHPEIAVLFTDIDMPGSMDGLRLSAAVRDRWPPVRIIITSGKRQPDPHVMPLGGVFVPKPYAPDKVAATIHRVLG